ncbi:unnamed protein product [Brassica oleracea]
MKKPVWHVASPLMAEILAIREALLYCRAHDLSSIRIESDPSQLINAIKKNQPISEIHSVLSDIALLSSAPPTAPSFHWITRLKNAVADSLAKDALCMVEDVMTLT